MQSITYYIVEGQFISQYRATFDKDKLSELRQKVIDTCSRVENVEHRWPAASHYVKIIQTALKNGSHTIYNIYSETRNLQLKKVPKEWERYDVSYEEWRYSNLVFIINGLIQGDTASLYRLLSYSPLDEYEKLAQQAKKLEQEIANIDDRSYLKKSKLGDLETTERKKNGIKLKEEAECHAELLKLLNIEHINFYNVEDVLDVLEFAGVAEAPADPVLKRLREQRKESRQKPQTDNPE